MVMITLLTDFGTQDEYVGAIKGVILGISPQATLVDICHHIEPQAIVSAGHMLRSVYRFFPEGTIHVAVVDPGVGSDRSILAASFDGYLFMAPDNGLLPIVWAAQTPDALVQVTNGDLFRHPVSRTFHGRDIFAPAAAHLSMGTPLAELGPAAGVDDICVLSTSAAGRTASGVLTGEVIHVDRFGNLITNIEAEQVRRLTDETNTSLLVIQMEGYRMEGLLENYEAGVPQAPVALIGSRNCVEIAVRRGSAARLLGMGQGTQVTIRLEDR